MFGNRLKISNRKFENMQLTNLETRTVLVTVSIFVFLFDILPIGAPHRGPLRNPGVKRKLHINSEFIQFEPYTMSNSDMLKIYFHSLRVKPNYGFIKFQKNKRLLNSLIITPI